MIKWTKTTGLKNLKKVNLMIMQAAKKEMSLFLKIKPSIKDSGKIALGTDKVFKSGQMELSTKAVGRIIKPMDREYFGMFMVISMKAIGKETKLMDMENIPTVMEPHTRETGETIYNTAEV